MTLEDYEVAIRDGVLITREMVLDNLADRAALESDPLWQRDFITENWWKRTPEFMEKQRLAEARLELDRPGAEMALANAVSELSRELPPQKRGPASFFAPNRLAYQEILSVPCGMSWEHHTYADAISAWRMRLLQYAAVQPGDVLWWRIEPEIGGRVPFGSTETFWCVYARLLIGNEADEGKLAAHEVRRYAEALVGR